MVIGREEEKQVKTMKTLLFSLRTREEEEGHGAAAWWFTAYTTW